MCLGREDTSDLISTVSFTFIMRRHLIRLASTPFTSFPWQSLVGFRLLTVCNDWQRSRTQNLRRMGRNSGSILSRLWTKVHEIFRRYIGAAGAFQRHCPIISSFIQKIFVIKSRSRRKTEQCFWLPIFEGTTPTFLRHIVNAIYCPPFGNV